MLTLNSSTFFCGRYGYSFWPIWSFRVADVVVADMVCGRYGLWPIWYRPVWENQELPFLFWDPLISPKLIELES